MLKPPLRLGHTGSHLVQWRAKRLLALYQEQNNEDKSKR